MKKLSDMTDEERYGKVGAEIRRLDPEAYKNRKDKSAAANMKLLRELRAKAKAPATGRSTAFEESRPSPKSETPRKKKTFLGALAAKYGTAGQRERGAKEGYRPGDITKSLKAGLGTQRTREELADEYEGAKVAPTALMGLAGGAAGMGGRAALRYGAKKLAERSASKKAASKASDAAAERAARGASRRNMPSYSDRYRAGETAAARRAEFRQRRRDEAERRLDERLASDMEGGFRRGGGVKKYNKGGKIDGVAKRGKTRCRII